MRRSGLPLTRRQFLGTGLAALVSTGCGSGPDVFTGPVGEDTARLQARPTPPTRAVQPGQHNLELGSGRNGVFYVPAAYRPETPAPLMVMLHGAGGGADNMAALAPLAEEVGAILLVPESRGRTWDVILGGYGPDVASLDRALTYVFERCAVDPARLGISGFSDGASYGLSLGLTNGDLFPHILAFSPGFIAPPRRVGKPRVFISHGVQDNVLPIELSRRIVRELVATDYDVLFREFDGGHIMSRALVREAFARLAG